MANESETIQEVYDRKPTSGDDPTKNYLIGAEVDGTGEEAVLNNQQLANYTDQNSVKLVDHNQRLTDLENSTLPPAPEPYWTVNILQNTMTASLAFSGYTGTAWAITRDTDVPPVYPDDFTISNTPPATFNLLTPTTAELWRFFQFTPENNVEEIRDFDGASGITVTPSYTAIEISDFQLTLATPPSSAFDATWTDPNIIAGTQILDRYDILDFETNQVIRPNVTSPVNFVDMNSGQTFTYFLRATYTNGQVVDSNLSSVTTDDLAVGTVSIEQPPSARDTVAGAGGYEISEESPTPLLINVNLSNPAGPAGVQVDYHLVDKTAVAGVNYVAASGTLTWAPGETTATIAVQPINATSPLNLCLQAELIDNANKTPGLNIDTAKYPNAYGNGTLVYINGQSGGVEGFVQSTDEDATICFDCENANGIDVLAKDSSDVDIPASEFVEEANAGAYNGVFVNTGYYYRFDSLTPTDPNYIGRAARRDFKVNFTAPADTYYFWARMRSANGSWNDDVSLDVDQNLEAGLRKFQVFIPPTNDRPNIGWAWVKTDSWTALGQVGARRTAVVAPGQHIISLHQYDQGMRADRIFITKNPNLDPAVLGLPGASPTNDDNYGPEQSAYDPGTGSAVDYALNPDFPSVPVDPLLAKIAPSSYNPLDNDLTVDYQIPVISAQYDDAASIVDYKMRVFSWDGVDVSTSAEISGVVELAGPAMNRIEFRPAATLSQNQDYWVEVIGSALDGAGQLRHIDFGSHTEWNFKTVLPITSGLVYQVNFDNYQQDTPYSVSLAESDFIALPTVVKFSTKLGTGVNIVDSPDGNPARGKVMEINYAPKQTTYHFQLFQHYSSSHYNIFPDTSDPNRLNYPLSNEANGTTQNPGGPPYSVALARENAHDDHVAGGGDPYRFDELYCAQDIFFPADWQYLNFHKLGGMCTGTALQSSHGQYGEANREGFYGFTFMMVAAAYEWSGSGNYTSPNPVPHERTGSLSAYFYTTDGIAITEPCNVNDPTRRPSAPGDYYIMPRGKWFTIEQRLKLNTADNDYQTLYPGPGEDYLSPGTRGYWPPIAAAIGLPDGNIKADARTNGDLVDGVYEIWVMEEGETKARKILSRTVRMRTWQFAKITATAIRFYNNSNSNTNPSLPSVNQKYYADNFRGSQNPILPR